jgi:trehalose 6-phosphate synthase
VRPVGSSSLLIASNRGPVAFGEDGSVRRGAGGLVSALAAAGVPEGAVWVCAALSEGDRRAVRAGRAGPAPGSTARVRMLDIDPVTFDRAYNSVANSTLWFVSHLLYAIPSVPAFGERSRREWDAYVEYNDRFAAALAEEAAPGATALVQDYHLSLAPRLLRARRPDLRIAHFSHTPWAPPEYFRLLPDPVARDLLTGLLGADAVGFHSSRWADAFARCCVEALGAAYADDCVTHEGHVTRVEVHPLGVDGPELTARAHQPDVEAKLGWVRDLAGDRQLVLRVDRTELSKNIVRGLESFRELLRRFPEHRERVVHLAFAYPSRHDLPEYREYTGAVQRVAREVNEEFATPGWLPVHLEVKDDYPRSLAAMRLADVLVVNPLRDGMNLVAKEGPVLSEKGVGLVLSREAGAADDLGPDALLVNPFDVSQTAEALHEALVMDRAERSARSARLAKAATTYPPSRWLADQLGSVS